MRIGGILASAAALSAIGMMSREPREILEATGTPAKKAKRRVQEPAVHRPVIRGHVHQSSRQRARYARQVVAGQIRNAVCAWWCYPAVAGD